MTVWFENWAVEGSSPIEPQLELAHAVAFAGIPLLIMPGDEVDPSPA